MKGCCPVGRLVQGEAGGRDCMVATRGAVVLEVGHVSRSLLLLGEAVPCLAFR